MNRKFQKYSIYLTEIFCNINLINLFEMFDQFIGSLMNKSVNFFL